MKSTELFSKVPVKLLWKKIRSKVLFLAPCSFVFLTFSLLLSHFPFLLFSFSFLLFLLYFLFPFLLSLSFLSPLLFSLSMCGKEYVLKQQNIYWLKAIMPKPRINITLRKYMLTLHDSPWRWKTDILFNQ